MLPEKLRHLSSRRPFTRKMFTARQKLRLLVSGGNIVPRSALNNIADSWFLHEKECVRHQPFPDYRSTIAVVHDG